MKAKGVEIKCSISDSQKSILTEEALIFIATLQRAFNPRRLELLQLRKERERKIQLGQSQLKFHTETKKMRDDPIWQVAKPGPGLIDRRVEITGPPERKMLINALNSGANCFMADLEDSSSPTWNNMVDGQKNLKDAVLRTINFKSGEKEYKLNSQVATLLVRPRGWHLDEKNILIDGQIMSASLFDFGLYFYHNAWKTLEIGQGPYFYLPKMESYLEARLWNDVFNLAQDIIGMPRGTIRATVLIETIWAAFEMEEILFELREHSSGLNCGRWDYIFSFIKVFRYDSSKLLSDRHLVTMGPETKFMNSYVKLLIHTCHKRGAHAMGGMAAQIPIKNDKTANEKSINKVIEDKKREALAGHDGTWVAHPALVKIAKDIFDQYMPTPNQIYKKSRPYKLDSSINGDSSYFLNTYICESESGCNICEEDLINCKPFNLPNNEPQITESGIRHNLEIALTYLESWISGIGCVPIMNLMEDAATAEISRVQLWFWSKHRVPINSNKGAKASERVTADLITKLLNEEYELLFKTSQHKESLKLAKSLLQKEILGDDNHFSDFLTILGYDHIINKNSKL